MGSRIPCPWGDIGTPITLFGPQVFPRTAVAAATGRLDHEDIARRHLGRADVTQFLARAVDPFDPVPPLRAGVPAGHAERRDRAIVGKDRSGHRFEEADPARGDFVVALYNPKSRRRTEQLVQALAMLSEERAPQTPVVVARALGRPDEHVTITTLAKVDPDRVDMTTLLIVGSSATRVIDAGRRQWVFTPRGYAQKGKP